MTDSDHRVAINRQRLLDRFLRYVQIDTAADPTSDAYPSSKGQWELGRVIRDELAAMSADDVQQDDNALVWGTVPTNQGRDCSTVALIAHLDTSPEAPSEQVKPQVIESYAGGDIPLANGETICSKQCAELSTLVGKTLVTTDGTTLLGGDDKAGAAIIMELAQTLIENPHLPHGRVKILMTCDEEIGKGTDKINLDQLDATVAYTLDGGGAGDIDVETFSADAATIRFVGHNIHPAIANGRMVNALRAAAKFVAKLPQDEMAPEVTEGRDGFIHPYQVEGGVGEAHVELLLRSFDSDQLEIYADDIRRIADTVVSETAGLSVEVDVRRQYRNLREGLAELPESIAFAKQAFENLGRPVQQTIVRGGTDGSQLTEKGLPTPNLSSGQHNIHSVHEFACLDEMVEAVEHLVELLALWSQHRS